MSVPLDRELRVVDLAVGLLERAERIRAAITTLGPAPRVWDGLATLARVESDARLELALVAGELPMEVGR